MMKKIFGITILLVAVVVAAVFVFAQSSPVTLTGNVLYMGNAVNGQNDLNVGKVYLYEILDNETSDIDGYLASDVSSIGSDGSYSFSVDTEKHMYVLKALLINSSGNYSSGLNSIILNDTFSVPFGFDGNVTFINASDPVFNINVTEVS